MFTHAICRRLIVPLVLFCGLTRLPACSSGSGPVDEDTDTTPPAFVTDLVALDVTTTTTRLEWTAPGDRRGDGSTGMVAAYDLRMAGEAITEANFAQALPVPDLPEPLPVGQRHRLTVTGLTPGGTYWFALKSRDDKDNWSGLSDCPRADCLQVEMVQFPDAALELAIREHVHKPVGDLLSSDVDTLAVLTAPARGIVSLEGLEHCTSLVTAGLQENDIVGLAPLHMLPNLINLYLDWNQVSDLQPLVSLVQLQQLHLVGNPLTNLSPLSSLWSLRQLTLSEQTITDFTPLYALAYLNDFYLGAMNLDNIDFAAHLTHLRNFSLELNHITSVEPLGPLTDLESLNLMQNDIVDIGPLAGLTKLRELHLGKNLIVDLQPLVDNAGLGAGDIVRVDENPLSASAVELQIPALEARGVTVVR